MYCPFFFFNDTATTEIYTLSLHDALPIYPGPRRPARCIGRRGPFDAPLGDDLQGADARPARSRRRRDRKSTRLNSSHSQISYAVFCLKKKTRRPKTLDGILGMRAYPQSAC